MGRSFADACEAIGPETNIDTRSFQFGTRKAEMPEVVVAARAMDDAHPVARQLGCVVAPEVIHVRSQQVWLQVSNSFQVGDWRAAAAIAHITLAFKPVEERAIAVHEHFELFFRFSNM